MKLAEALARRKDLNTRIKELGARAQAQATHVKGEEPTEDPRPLLAEIERLTTEVGQLTVQINTTNNLNGIMERTVKRDQLKGLSGIWRGMANQGRGMRYGREEIVYVQTLEITETNAKADEFAAEARALDMEIQELDWTVELV